MPWVEVGCSFIGPYNVGFLDDVSLSETVRQVEFVLGLSRQRILLCHPQVHRCINSRVDLSRAVLMSDQGAERATPERWLALFFRADVLTAAKLSPGRVS